MNYATFISQFKLNKIIFISNLFQIKFDLFVDDGFYATMNKSFDSNYQ